MRQISKIKHKNSVKFYIADILAVSTYLGEVYQIEDNLK